MPKWKVVVGYRSYDTLEVEVEAPTQDEAENAAIAEAQNTESKHFYPADNEWLIVETEKQE